jgi:hypothetical protein
MCSSAVGASTARSCGEHEEILKVMALHLHCFQLLLQSSRTAVLPSPPGLTLRFALLLLLVWSCCWLNIELVCVANPG